MKHVLMITVLLFGGFFASEMNAQACCAAKSACKSTASVGKSEGGVAVAAIPAVQVEKNAVSKKSCAAASTPGVKTAAGAEDCNPANCDPANCNPANCDPAKCDLTKCKPAKTAKI